MAGPWLWGADRLVDFLKADASSSFPGGVKASQAVAGPWLWGADSAGKVPCGPCCQYSMAAEQSWLPRCELI